MNIKYFYLLLLFFSLSIFSEKTHFLYSDSASSEYLTELRNTFDLDDLVKECDTEVDKMLTVCNWVNNLWEHDSWNTPADNDPISIIKAAKSGEKFRCVEYSTVIAGCLNSLGIYSRVVSLKTKDAETREFGAGHVVVEAYSDILKKWIMIDGQADMIPYLDGRPLNLLELKNAINDCEKVYFKSLSIPKLATDLEYVNFIKDYLYYFDTQIDNRYGVDRDVGKIMLIPKGAKKPKVFQVTISIVDMVYTEDQSIFYSPPTNKSLKKN